MITAKMAEGLTLAYPEGFHVMTESEKSGMQFFGGLPGECLSDPERHILISVGLKTVGGVSAFRKPMQKYGYRLLGFAEKSVGSEKAEGFSYEYESQCIGMYGESCVVKRGKVLYYLNFYARRELLGESLDVWNMILSSAKWS